MTDFALNAEVRSDLGKGASRRLRRLASLVPAVIYGGDKAPQSISLIAKDFAKLLETEASYSHILSLNVGGTKENVLIKALQRHPAKGFVLHADFIRVVAGQKLTAHVPLHFTNQEGSVGVKQQGQSSSKSIWLKLKSARSFTCPTLSCQKALNWLLWLTAATCQWPTSTLRA